MPSPFSSNKNQSRTSPQNASCSRPCFTIMLKGHFCSVRPGDFLDGRKIHQHQIVCHCLPIKLWLERRFKTVVLDPEEQPSHKTSLPGRYWGPSVWTSRWWGTKPHRSIFCTSKDVHPLSMFLRPCHLFSIVWSAAKFRSGLKRALCHKWVRKMGREKYRWICDNDDTFMTKHWSVQVFEAVTRPQTINRFTLSLPCPQMVLVVGFSAIIYVLEPRPSELPRVNWDLWLLPNPCKWLFFFVFYIFFLKSLAFWGLQQIVIACDSKVPQFGINTTDRIDMNRYCRESVESEHAACDFGCEELHFIMVGCSMWGQATVKSVKQQWNQMRDAPMDIGPARGNRCWIWPAQVAMLRRCPEPFGSPWCHLPKSSKIEVKSLMWNVRELDHTYHTILFCGTAKTLLQSIDARMSQWKLCLSFGSPCHEA